MQLYRDIEIQMKGAVDHLHDEMKQLRTGRASLAILDGLTVEYYGTPTPLNQVCNLAVTDATLITAQPWDPNVISAIEKAIMTSNLGLNPSNDGKLVRIPVPQLTEERRKDLVKRAHDMAEATRNSIRQARREGNDKLKQMKNDKEISEDDEHRGYQEMQKLHDHYIGLVAQAVETKEKDIMEV
jgi:ribosome recycling factor